MVEIKDPLSQPMANPFAEDDVLKDFVPPRVQTADVRTYFYKGKEYQVAVMRDPEGNGGGHLDIVNLEENKND